MNAQTAKITAQIVVRDKDGKVKYEGPLVMDVVHEEKSEQEINHGGNAPDSGQDRGR